MLPHLYLPSSFFPFFVRSGEKPVASLTSLEGSWVKAPQMLDQTSLLVANL